MKDQFQDHADQSTLLGPRQSFHPVCRKCRKRHLIGECQVDRLWGWVAVMIWGMGVLWLVASFIRRFF